MGKLVPNKHIVGRWARMQVVADDYKTNIKSVLATQALFKLSSGINISSKPASTPECVSVLSAWFQWDMDGNVMV